MHRDQNIARLGIAAAMLLTGLLAQSASSYGEEGPQVTRVDHETTKPKRAAGLGTKEYEPSENEKAFFEKLAPEERATGGLLGDYDIEQKNGTYVGWFGIVREIADEPEQKRSVLSVEHKYFDGFTDTHIQALSFNGSGDFHCIVRGLDHGIKPLTLVRVYGPAKVSKDEGVVVEAEFVRNWHWGTFTFISADGAQRGSEKWRQLNQVPLDDIYDPYPNNDYYEQRLGPKPIDEKQRARRIEKAGNISPALRTALPRLLDQLEANEWQTLEQSLKGLENAPDKAALALVFVEYLGDEDDAVQRLAGIALSDLGDEAFPPVRAALRHESPRIRAGAAASLGRMGQRAVPAVSELTILLNDQDAAVRFEAIETLEGMGEPASEAAATLKTLMQNHPDLRTRFQAAGALWSITSEPTAVVATYVELFKLDEELRQGVVQSLGEMGGGAQSAASLLFDALGDDDPYIRYEACEALPKIGVPADEAVPRLKELLGDEDADMQTSAVRAIEEYGPEAKATVPELTQALESDDEHLRFSIAGALAAIGPDAAPALPKLIALVNTDDSDSVRWHSAGALGAIDTEGKSVVPALIEACQQSSPNVRRFALFSVSKIGPHAKDARDVVQKCLKDPDAGARVAAAEAWYKVTGQSAESVEVLSAALESFDWRVRMWAEDAVESIGPPAAATVPKLIANLNYPIEHVRDYAIDALGAIGSESKPAVPELSKLMKDPSTSVRGKAASALWRIAEDPQATAVLIDVLKTGDHWDRQAAANALAQIGPAAESAIPALEQAAESHDLDVRAAAASALAQIRAASADGR